jgi:hypothetical protein
VCIGESYTIEFNDLCATEALKEVLDKTLNGLRFRGVVDVNIVP